MAPCTPFVWPWSKPVAAAKCAACGKYESVSRMVEELVTRLQDEADLCRNEGAEDIAKLLEEAAQMLQTLQGVAPNT